MTPLLFAIGQAAKAGLHCRQLLSLIETLLELGADAAAVDSEGKGALLYLTTSSSTRHINVEAFEQLVARLAAAGAAVHQPHPDTGVTPLVGPGRCKGGRCTGQCTTGRRTHSPQPHPRPSYKSACTRCLWSALPTQPLALPSRKFACAMLILPSPDARCRALL